jgi:hypothetical protein
MDNNRLMNIIIQNPYRVLGLIGNASEREIQKQIGIVKRLVEIGKSKFLDNNFEFIGEISRTVENVREAASRIEQDYKRLHYSLFWFVINNQFDEIAINDLKEQNIIKAIALWEKILKREVSKKNYSCYLNLSTLYIALSTINRKVEITYLQRGIYLKGILIHSNYLLDLSTLVTGNNLTINTTEIGKNFIEEMLDLLKPYLNKRNGITTIKLISLFDSFPQIIQNYLTNKLTEGPLSYIENKIEEIAIRREKNPSDLDALGEELFKSTSSDIILLKKILGGNSLKLQLITDKLAMEIFRCSVDYNNSLINDSVGINSSNHALKIAIYARSLRPKGQTKNRIEKGIQEMKIQDCYQVINLLKVVKETLLQINKRNQSVDKAKVIIMLKKEISKNIVRKIGNSSNQALIADFYELSTYISNRLNQVKYIDYLLTILHDILPVNNQIREKIAIDSQMRKISGHHRQTIPISSSLEKVNDIYSRKINLNSRIRTVSLWLGLIVGITMIIWFIWGLDGLGVVIAISFIALLGWARGS